MKKTLIPVAAILAAAALAAIALGSSSLTLRTSASRSLGETVVVNPAGRTLYSLSGEGSHRLLCRSSECAGVWPPLTVPSRTTRLKASASVHGPLGLIRRPNGALQVTLRGKPLYRYAGDTGPGQTHGQGIHSFGGVWHAVTAAAGAAPAPPPTQPPMTTPESAPPYGY